MSTIETQNIEDAIQVPLDELEVRSERWKAYYELTKPGITKMVVLTASAGYFLAVESPLAFFAQVGNIVHFLFTILGTTMVAAGSCAINHFIERDYDRMMKRTARRPLPSGKLLPMEALIYGLALCILGIGLLCFINMTTVLLALITLVGYVAVYTPMKTRTELNTLVGAVPGALPAMGGWVAVSGDVTLGSLAMFAIVFFWQLPHFLSLSWMYRQDYAVPGFKMLAVRDESGTIVARHVVLYTICLAAAVIMPFVLGATGIVYAVGSVLLVGYMLMNALRFTREVSSPNARKVLLSSYVFLLGVIILMFADKA